MVMAQYAAIVNNTPLVVAVHPSAINYAGTNKIAQQQECQHKRNEIIQIFHTEHQCDGAVRKLIMASLDKDHYIELDKEFIIYYILAS